MCHDNNLMEKIHFCCLLLLSGCFAGKLEQPPGEVRVSTNSTTGSNPQASESSDDQLDTPPVSSAPSDPVAAPPPAPTPPAPTPPSPPAPPVSPPVTPPAVACGQKSLFDRLSTTTLDVGVPVRARGLRAVAMYNGDVVVGWHGQSGGDAHLTRFTSAGARVGADIVLAGATLMGLTSDGSNFGVLIRRGASPVFDEMHWVLVNGAGQVLAQEKLVGGMDRNVIGSEWLDDDLATVRWNTKAGLVWTGTHYAAYYNMRRRWPDNIDHQGDQQRLFNVQGARVAGGWDWGCSHSLDLSLTAGGGASHAVCMSDCFPKKGLIYRAATTLFEDPSGNCGGTINSVLGDGAYVNNTFFVTMSSPTTRASADIAIASVGPSGPGALRWLSSLPDAESGTGLSSFGSGMLVGWRVANNRAALLALSTSGEPIGAAEVTSNASLRALFDEGRTAFFGLIDHDAAWLTVVGATIKLVRVDAC